MRNFLFFLFLLFLLAVFLRVDFFFTILYLLFAVYLLSRLWMRRTVEEIETERRYVERAFHGDSITVDLALRNTGWLPVPWLELNESLPLELASPPFYRQVISLGPREQRKVRYTLDCRKRGYYPLGPLRMRSGDLLGLQRPRLSEAPPVHLTVYPRVVPLEKLGFPTNSPLVVLPARSPLFEDPARVWGVRDYRRGDSPRRIHWSSTARAGRLVVKQYQPAIARETLIFLDLNGASYERNTRYDAVEQAITVAASVASHVALREHLPVGLTVDGFDPREQKQLVAALPPRSERAHLISLMEILARIEMGNGTPIEELLRRESPHLSWGATLAIITGGMTQELTETISTIRRAGFTVVLIVIQYGALSAQMRRQAGVLGIHLHQIWRDQDMGVLS